MTNPDLDAAVARLKGRITEAQRAMATAERQFTIATSNLDNLVAAFRDDYGISPDEAPALIAQTEADLAAEVARVEALLDKAQGSSE